ncbi:S41 family peptidase [Tenacibaculum sp. C7A-26P2]|uniref:S41 family peptidase n=1 Tax=Tenacibaculum sp. C7A-26P2 TaxID=3447504 RepID=UPI003F856E4F
MKKITFFLQIVTLSIVLIAFQGCREESLEIAELDRSYFDVTSYDKLFETFWDTMNNNYNFFNEQETNWDKVYREYSPKFKALTTFGRSDVNPALAMDEAEIAFKYFADIINDNIIDEHFGLTVNIPLPSTTGLYGSDQVSEFFRKNTKYKYTKEDGFVNLFQELKNPRIFVSKGVMSNKLDPATRFSGGPLLSGFLIDDPETMYIRLEGFSITPMGIETKFPRLNDINNLSGINQVFFSDLKKLDNEFGTLIETLINDNFKDFKTLIKNIIASDEYKTYVNGLDKFRNTELVDDLQGSLLPLITFIRSNKKDYTKSFSDIDSLINTYFGDPNKTRDQKINLDNLYSAYLEKTDKYRTVSGFEFEGETGTFDLDIILSFLDISYPFEIFKRLFNPITNGTAKKIIIDLRGNGGGYVNDARIFTDRFLTKQAVWGYQRTKEGNGRFNYSPWFPNVTAPHKFGLKQDIPIAVLVDKGSVSMAEISTMMIKSQGNHVTILGDNSLGGTAGLGGNDDYNGGSRSNNYYLDFYMPLMAFKDSQGNVIEGTGVTPDTKVIPTNEEASAYFTTGFDPVFNAALEALK